MYAFKIYLLLQFTAVLAYLMAGVLVCFLHGWDQMKDNAGGVFLFLQAVLHASIIAVALVKLVAKVLGV